MARFQPLVQQPRLTEEVTTLIRNEILDGAYGPGERILQADVARQLNVSRAPVREAMRSLIAEGLVRDEPRRGTFVVDHGPGDIREIFDLRVALEVRASQLVLGGDPAATIAAMAESLDRMAVGLEQSDPFLVSRADAAFHLLLCQGSGNHRLIRTYEQHAAPLRQLLRIDNREVHTKGDRTLVEHRKILRLLEVGDADVVGRELTRHIEVTRDRLVEYVSARRRTQPLPAFARRGGQPRPFRNPRNT